MILQALPWLLVAVATLALGIELLVSHKVYAKAETMVAELLQQQRLDQADVDEARRAYHRVLGERDLARATVRDLLAAREAGYRWPTPQPLPMPPDVDDALTDKFTQITGRHAWPKWPDK